MTITYDQAFEKLDSLVESALLSYDVEVLTEEGEGEGTAANPKARSFIAAAAAGLKKLWAVIYEMLVDLYRNAKAKLTGTEEVRFAATDFLAAGDPSKAIQLLNSLQRPTSEYNPDDLTAQFGTDKSFKASVVIENARKLSVMAKKLAAMTVASAGEGEKEWVKNVQDAGQKVKAISTLVSKALRATMEENKAQSLENKASKTYDEKTQIKMREKAAVAKQVAGGIRADNKHLADKKLTEGAEMTGAQKMAMLLIEAAQLLAEEGDETFTDDQKEIDEIPEETPATTVEQDPEVSGGEGEKVDLEEIKDLTGGDAETIALMTDDEGGAVCESVIIDFGF